MSRLLLALLALGALGYMAYWAMYNGKPGDDTQLPKQRLGNVQNAVDRASEQTQQQLDDIAKQTAPE